MRLSYAQNLEDYHLDLAFRGQSEGTYVDVGGGHPVADNVTFYFYLKGWRGLVVEPQADLALTHRRLRPRDIVYEGLAGSRDGEAEFHQVEGLHGLSSMVRSVADEAGRFGASYKTVRMPMRRLDRLVAEAGFTRIDFLKVDVEGAEDEVLAGLDLGKIRPRIVVVEAVNPGNPDGTKPGAWDARLRAAGYTFVLFDRLNRFYVAPGEAELATRLPKEPAPWDQVPHLWDHGRASENAAHGDHALAKVLIAGLMAKLPALDGEQSRALISAGLTATGGNAGSTSPETIAMLLGKTEYPGNTAQPADLTDLVASDRFRACLGRIACFYDGGHVME